MNKHKKKFLLGSDIMFIGAIGFVLYAFSNPQASFRGEMKYLM